MKYLCLSLLLSSAASKVLVMPGGGYSSSSYSSLESSLEKLNVKKAHSLSFNTRPTSHICFAHSNDGAATLLTTMRSSLSSRCDQGVIIYGASPSPQDLQDLHVPVLVIAGTMDGVNPLTHFAVSKNNAKDSKVTFAALKGASHHSVVDSLPSSMVYELDLKPVLTSTDAISSVSAIVSDFLLLSNTGALREAVELGDKIANPIVQALTLEGSAQLHKDICNSDFPTNPTCQYPKYPDHSLPPGAHPAPNPLPSTDCVCGSPWIMTVAGDINAGLPLSSRPTVTIETKDAFHDVADTHPFHLPHVFNNCDADLTKPCNLNSITVTMSVLKNGDLVPANVTSLSAFELKTKFKSRQAIWQNAGLGSGTKDLDNNNVCKQINQQAYEWALNNADSDTRKMFEESGEPFVIVDDVTAPIGITGPTWIAKEMLYTRVRDASGKSHIEVQSWSFVVGNTNDGNLPWLFPVGMHYCKLLSPARAMEWIYTDGLRASRSLH